ncbi:HNH endonuclease [Gimesia sp.]|uniref:HNH endonuclease n=1 Tax=Gimesia sp. TaxID=2024833 RepID=UPI003A8C8C0B
MNSHWSDEELEVASFLYTWNPDDWNWIDLQDAIYRVNNDKNYCTHWSCGSTKHKIHIGDMFFLMRLGVDPKGIVGCGYITSTPFLLPHWDKEKAAKGITALQTDTLFKALSNVPIIPLEDLKAKYPNYGWTPIGGGVTIPGEIATDLLSFIVKDEQHEFEQQSVEKIHSFSEGSVKTVTCKSYDRSAEARQSCLEHWGYTCIACGFKFEDKYGELGRDYIEVHHLKPISEIGEEYEINPIDDLRPVCANCHRMLHMKKPALSIQELESLINLGSN